MSLKYRRHLRKEATNPERIIWQKLRNRQIGGIKFRRQHSIGKYIVDFYSSELNLIIEIDGDVHAYQKKMIKQEKSF